MRLLASNRLLSSLTVSLSLLAGCSGSQPPIGAPGAMPQTSAIAEHRIRGTSSSGELLYVSGWGAQSHGVDIFTYPEGKYVSEFTMPNDDLVLGMCSDAKGNVFIDAISFDNFQFSGGYIFEYAHGGTVPTATLTDSTGLDEYAPQGCSVDPESGDLAVGNVYLQDGVNGNLSVFKGAHGAPARFSTSVMRSYESPTYDANGNVFVLGLSPNSDREVIELPKGSGSFLNVSITGKIKNPRWVQWDGSELAFLGGNELNGSHAHPIIYRVAISGSLGTVTGLVKLKGTLNSAGGGFWIQGGSVIVPAGHKKKIGWEVGVWNYPAGGNATAIMKTGTIHAEVATVSVGSTGH
jgi:hypothetical protein